jgi:abortive infection bacteriophage resistance protein
VAGFLLREEVMKYSKPALSFEQQAQQLIDRGLIVSDQDFLAEHLSTANYYRLSAYWYPFKRIDPVTGEEHFAPDTTFEKIWRRYTFDRQLRLLVMDAIEHIEVAILRTRMVEHFTLRYGPFGYCQQENFSPKFSKVDFKRLLREINNGEKNSREEFVGRFRRKYTSEKHLPLWIAAEVMTFGQLYTFFRNLHRSEQQKLSRDFDLYPPVMESWLHTLNFIRNACAHHARLWNRQIPIRPKIPDQRHHPEWYIPNRPDNRRTYSVLILIQYLMKYIEPTKNWQEKFDQLLAEYPEIPTRSMGFSESWHECPIWK